MLSGISKPIILAILYINNSVTYILLIGTLHRLPGAISWRLPIDASVGLLPGYSSGRSIVITTFESGVGLVVL